MRERNFEWNLAFATAEVIEGIEKMCANEAYLYSKEERDSATHYCLTLPDGIVTLSVHPNGAQIAPFNAILKFHRTMLNVSMPEVAPQTVETLHRKLMLAFLRAGG